MNTIVWEVLFHSPPEAQRHCAKCGFKTRFASSGRFRVNAQQKYLDVWLVYKCVRCKGTWNLTIYARVNPKALGPARLRGFTANDEALAWRYAMDEGLLKRNGAETEEAPYSILGGDLPPGGEARVMLVSRYPSKIKVSKLVREKLSLSKGAFDALASRGRIRLEDGGDVQKARLLGETALLISLSDENDGISAEPKAAHPE